MLKRTIGTREIIELVNDLYKKYPNGFVANIKKGKVPKKSRGLARYLARYIVSPPIALKRIISYNGKEVEYLV